MFVGLHISFMVRSCLFCVAKVVNVIGKLLIGQGWESLETVIAAESLALVLQSAGSLVEAKELLQRFL